mgnify:FL=1
MMSSRLPIRFVLALAFSISLVGCGGGAGGGGTSSTAVSPGTGKVLRWTPPQSFADQTPLNPAKDLAHYDIYINDSGKFSSTDASTATVSAVDPANGNLVTSFDLGNLGPFLSAGKKYFVSMQSISNTGVKSAFSTAISFSL